MKPAKNVKRKVSRKPLARKTSRRSKAKALGQSFHRYFKYVLGLIAFSVVLTMLPGCSSKKKNESPEKSRKAPVVKKQDVKKKEKPVEEAPVEAPPEEPILPINTALNETGQLDNKGRTYTSGDNDITLAYIKKQFDANTTTKQRNANIAFAQTLRDVDLRMNAANGSIRLDFRIEDNKGNLNKVTLLGTTLSTPQFHDEKYIFRVARNEDGGNYDARVRCISLEADEETQECIVAAVQIIQTTRNEQTQAIEQRRALAVIQNSRAQITWDITASNRRTLSDNYKFVHWMNWLESTLINPHSAKVISGARLQTWSVAYGASGFTTYLISIYGESELVGYSGPLVSTEKGQKPYEEPLSVRPTREVLIGSYQGLVDAAYLYQNLGDGNVAIRLVFNGPPGTDEEIILTFAHIGAAIIGLDN